MKCVHTLGPLPRALALPSGVITSILRIDQLEVIAHVSYLSLYYALLQLRCDLITAQSHDVHTIEAEFQQQTIAIYRWSLLVDTCDSPCDDAQMSPKESYFFMHSDDLIA